MAEAVRFELTVPCGTPVFKTGALNHYATPPDTFLLFRAGFPGLSEIFAHFCPALFRDFENIENFQYPDSV